MVYDEMCKSEAVIAFFFLNLVEPMTFLWTYLPEYSMNIASYNLIPARIISFDGFDSSFIYGIVDIWNKSRIQS